jgi:hypothetical protein
VSTKHRNSRSPDQGWRVRTKLEHPSGDKLVKLIVQRKRLTVFVYSLAAVAASLFWFIHQEAGSLSASLLASFLEWLLLLAAPLLFVAAYSSFLFGPFGPQTSRLRYPAVLYGLAASITTLLFVILGSDFSKNPMRDADSLLSLMVPVIALPVFFVAALYLLFKDRSSLAKFASFLFWPYLLLFALVSLNRFFEASILRTAFCFFCLLSSVLFAFAAGAISHSPTLAHSSALAGLLGMPYIYWTTLRDTPLGNTWTMFNVSDRKLLSYSALHLTELTILSVALIVLAIATAALRLLPARWSLRGLPLCERTWPAFGATFLFLAIWFSQSVMPYRISGAVDYSSWPILQILHIEKRGLQFHETCVSVWGYRGDLTSVYFSSNDRRLFEYRFQREAADSTGELQQPLTNRVQAVIRSSESASRNPIEVKPLRKWNEDGWYVTGQGLALKAYTTDKGETPPEEIVGLFNDLEKLPRSVERHSELRDVCLGFCYDPLSGLGAVYANHRCRSDEHGEVVCR